ncbi:hypothetical protein CKF43_00810 [Pantoea graminicola]|nr:hypothetical protein CKF43_00810 [Pantoea sp. ARC607]
MKLHIEPSVEGMAAGKAPGMNLYYEPDQAELTGAAQRKNRRAAVCRGEIGSYPAREIRRIKRLKRAPAGDKKTVYIFSKKTLRKLSQQARFSGTF